MQAPGKNPGPHRAFIFTIYSHPRILSQRHIRRRDLPAPCQGAVNVMRPAGRTIKEKMRWSN
jgi:hypothetical protein